MRKGVPGNWYTLSYYKNNLWQKMIKKLKELEQKIFTAPYRWLIKKWLIVAKKVYLTMHDLYDKNIVKDYRGNPNWSGDD